MGSPLFIRTERKIRQGRIAALEISLIAYWMELNNLMYIIDFGDLEKEENIIANCKFDQKHSDSWIWLAVCCCQLNLD